MFIHRYYGFINALKNESTKRRIKEIMYNDIKRNPVSVKRIKAAIPAGGEIYHFLETTLENNIGIVMVVEKKTPELEEVIDSISTNMNLQSHILEFITYQNDKGKKIHLLDTLPFLAFSLKSRKKLAL